MSFKENLLTKIRIDKLAEAVNKTVGVPGGGKKIDKDSMKALLELGPFSMSKERDLNLYSHEKSGAILVLDNELAIYNTTPEDVVLRKSPLLKEMLNIRNAIKILNDSDVVASKGKQSIATVQKECVARLDLSFDEGDIKAIENDGRASLERDFSDGVLEVMDLYREILGYSAAPKPFKVSNCHIIGEVLTPGPGKKVLVPCVIYNRIHNRLYVISRETASHDKGKIEFMHAVAGGIEKAPLEGPEVFSFLTKKVIAKGSV